MEFKRTALRPILTHLVIILGFLAITSMFFYPEWNDEVIEQGDIIAFRAKSKELIDLRKEHNRQILWSNAIFGGMPSVMVSLSHPSNKIHKLRNWLKLGVTKSGVGMFLTMMISFYILLLSLRANPWLAGIGAVAYAFGTDFMTLYEAGHNSKVHTFGYLPLVAAGFIMLFQKRWLWGGLVFTVGSALALTGHHPQMLYYVGLTMVIGIIAYFIHALKNGQLSTFVKALVIMLVGSILALSTSASYYWTTWDFSSSTMRGAPVLESTASNDGSAASSSEVEGLEWNYAMSWSAGLSDYMTLFVPHAMGDASNARVVSGQKTYELMRRSGMPSQDGYYQAPLYWGKTDSTTGPDYVGIGVLFFFLFGLVALRGPLRWWVGLGSLLLILLSLGRNFPALQHLFFDYFPMYNKFRAHNSASSALILLLGLGGFYTVSQLVRGKIEASRIRMGLLVAGGITTAVCLFFALLGPMFFDFTGARDASIGQDAFIEAMIADRKSMMSNSAWRSLLVLGLTIGLLWAWLKEKVSLTMFLAGLAVVTITDLWTLDRRYIDKTDYKSQRQYDGNFAKRPADEQILAAETNRGDYRLFDISTFSTNQAAYWHNLVGGYHPAKLQRIQDIIDRHLSKGSPTILNMLNTKYVITQDEQLQNNPGALGPAWLVKDIKLVSSPEEEINALTGLDAANTAVVLDKEFDNYIGDFKPTGEGTIRRTKYIPDDLTYEVNVPSEQLAVFSEVWYGPKKGWRAYIDDKPVPHIRANYLLRAIRVPAGQHTIKFKFVPRSYVTGSLVSLTSSWLLILVLLGSLGFGVWDWYKRLPAEPAPVAPTTPKRKTKATTVKKKRRKK